MPRSGRLRSLIKESNESTKTKRLSYIPPFLILIFEIILLIHGYLEREIIVILLTSILLIISMIETILVSREIQEDYNKSNFDRILTIKLDDFITETREQNVKRIVECFVDKNSKYGKHRNELYHISCQILQTHKEEEWEEILNENLSKFISKNHEKTVDDLLKDFLKKHPSYKKYRDLIYEKICQIKVDNI